MKTNFSVNLDAVEVELTMAMPLSEWKHLGELLKHFTASEYPASYLNDTIDRIVSQVEKHAPPEIETTEKKIPCPWPDCDVMCVPGKGMKSHNTRQHDGKQPPNPEIQSAESESEATSPPNEGQSTQENRSAEKGEFKVAGVFQVDDILKKVQALGHTEGQFLEYALSLGMALPADPEKERYSPRYELGFIDGFKDRWEEEIRQFEDAIAS